MGFSPTMPQYAAGIRIDPPVSVPRAKSQTPAATSAAEPLLDPPEVLTGIVRVVRHPIGGVDASGRVFEQVRLAQELGAGRAEARDDRGITRRGRRCADGGRVRRYHALHIDVVLDRDRNPVQRSLRRPVGRLEQGDDRVESWPLGKTAVVGGEELEIRNLADPSPLLDLVYERESPREHRTFDRIEHRRLGASLPDREIPVDARMRLRRAAVERDEPLDRAIEVGRVETVERLRARGRAGENLARQPEVERSVARLLQGVGDREVRDGRREEHCAIRLLRPQESEDVVRHLGVVEVPGELHDALTSTPVDLAHTERAATPDEDAPRADVVGSEVHEGTHGSRCSYGFCDCRLVQSVLERDDEAIRCEARRDTRHRGLRIVCLHGEEHAPETIGQIVRVNGPSSDCELLDRPLDGETLVVHRSDVLGVDVGEDDVVPATGKASANGSADCPRSDDHVVHGSIFPDLPL